MKLNKIEESLDYFNKSKETKYNDFDPDYIIDLDIAQQAQSVRKEKSSEKICNETSLEENKQEEGV